MSVEISSCHIAYIDEKPGQEVFRISLTYDQKSDMADPFFGFVPHEAFVERIQSIPELSLAHEARGMGVVIDASAYDLDAAIDGLNKLDLKKSDGCVISIRDPINAYQPADYHRAGDALRDVYEAAKDLRSRDPVLSAGDVSTIRVHAADKATLVQVTLTGKADSSRLRNALDNIGAKVSTNQRPNVAFYIAAADMRSNAFINKLSEIIPGQAQACLADGFSQACESVYSAVSRVQGWARPSSP